jgi:hypothetical protein
MAFINNIQPKQSPITIGKKWDKDAIYIGRGSPLGNPFATKNMSQEERDRVCDAYETWFHVKVTEGDTDVLAELSRIHLIANIKPVTLGCYCSPKRCHGETIKAFLDQYLI